MKVLINRTTNKISGAEIYIVNQLSELVKYKNIEIVFSSNNQNLNRIIKSFGYRIIRIRTKIPEVATKRQLFFSLSKLPGYIAEYKKILKENDDIDVFIFHSMTEKLFLSPLLSYQKKKIIWVEHGPIFAARWFVLIKKLYRLLGKNVTNIITVSEDTKKDLIANGLDERKIVVIPSGIDTIKFFPPSEGQKSLAKKKLGLQNKFIVGYVGTLTKEKGLDEIFAAAKCSFEKHLDIEFVLVGDGPDVPWISESIKNFNLKNIHLVGYQQNVKQFYAAMDIFLFPTHHMEGISLALVEAGAMGIPLIASDSGGNREIVTEITGILYKKFSLAQCISVLQKIKSDNRCFLELIKNARSLVEYKYSIVITTKKFYNFLQTL